MILEGKVGEDGNKEKEGGGRVTDEEKKGDRRNVEREGSETGAGGRTLVQICDHFLFVQGTVHKLFINNHTP